MLRARPQGHAIAYPTIIQTQLKCATSAWTKMLDASSWLQTFGGKPPSETLDIFVVIFLTIYLVSEPRRSPAGARRSPARAPHQNGAPNAGTPPEPHRSPTGAPSEWGSRARSPVLGAVCMISGAPSEPHRILTTFL